MRLATYENVISTHVNVPGTRKIKHRDKVATREEVALRECEDSNHIATLRVSSILSDTDRSTAKAALDSARGVYREL